MFLPSEAKIFKAVKIDKIFPYKLFSKIGKFFFFVFLISLILFLFFHFLEPKINLIFWENFKFKKELKEWSEISLYLSFVLFFIFSCWSRFSKEVLQNLSFSLPREEISEKENIANFLDFEAAKLVAKSFSSKSPFSLNLLLNLLKEKRLSFSFARLCLPRREIERKIKERKKEIQKSLSRKFSREEILKQAEEVILEAIEIAKENGEDKVSIFSLFSALGEKDPFFVQILNAFKLKKEDLIEASMWQKRIENIIEKEKRFWERDNLCYLFVTSVVQDFLGGYTLTLDQFSHDPMWKTYFLKHKTVLHQKEIEELEKVLIKERDNCALIVGEPGVGRKTIVYNLADKILRNLSFPELNYMRIVELDMPALIGASRDLRTLEWNLKRIFNEVVRAENIILVIPQIHNYIGVEFGAEAVARIDISSILSQYLSLPNFRLIGITTFDGYHRAIKRAPEVFAHFTKIEVSPPSQKEVLRVLEDEVLKKERKSGVFIPLPSLKEIVLLCDFYIGNVAFPKKALDLLDEVIVYERTKSQKREGIVFPEEVDAFFSQKFEIPVGAAGEREREILLNLESIIHERLIDQEEAVKEIANALRRARAGIRKRERPIGTFLFLGPTGVGKTETAKCLAGAYFGSRKRMIRLDMSEYQQIDSITRLIGDENQPGVFTTQVMENPFSLILLDEIEKAHPNILNLFLQVLDEGFLTDGAGRKVDFRHTIIIGTSNAGAELIRQAVKEKKDFKEFKEEFIDELLKRGIFRPEFLNRFDAIVLYKPLEKHHLLKIAEIMLKEIKEGLKEKNIEFLINQPLLEKIVELGYHPEFGAREMRRVIQEKVENNIAKAILSGTVKEGDKIEIDPESFEIKVYSSF